MYEVLVPIDAQSNHNCPLTGVIRYLLNYIIIIALRLCLSRADFITTKINMIIKEDCYLL